MAYKTILVCLNEIARNPVLLRLASDIAAKQNAHVVGLYVLPAVRMYSTVDPVTFAQLMEEYREFFNSRSAEVRQQFERAMVNRTFQAEWRLVDSRSPELATAVIEHAFQSDLVVLSQADPDSAPGVEADFAERVVMESGRPVLLVPSFGDFSECGPQALVGWNGRREGARAAFDAVPILQSCDVVRLTWVDPQKSMDVPGSMPGAELATALSRHGINVIAEGLPTSGIDVGEALISHVSEVGADLLVLGAYGHSRTREYVFGGVTRTIFDTMTVPVLMSH